MKLIFSSILTIILLGGLSTPKAEAYSYCPGTDYFCIGGLYFGTDFCSVLFNWRGDILSVWNCHQSGF